MRSVPRTVLGLAALVAGCNVSSVLNPHGEDPGFGDGDPLGSPIDNEDTTGSQNTAGATGSPGAAGAASNAAGNGQGQGQGQGGSMTGSLGPPGDMGGAAGSNNGDPGLQPVSAGAPTDPIFEGPDVAGGELPGADAGSPAPDSGGSDDPDAGLADAGAP